MPGTIVKLNLLVALIFLINQAKSLRIHRTTSTEDELSSSENEICNQPPDTGNCGTSSVQFYYNPSTDNCDSFDWGGCGNSANLNRFQSHTECVDTCQQEKKKPYRGRIHIRKQKEKQKQ